MRARQPNSTLRSRWVIGAATGGFVALALASAHTRFEQALGAGLIFGALTDIFLTVLYARMGTGIFGKQIAHLIWTTFRVVSRPLGRGRGRAGVLSFAGPAMLVVLLMSWMIMLTVGAAMIIHPTLGTTMRSSSGETPRDFVTALYAAAGTITSGSAGDLVARSSGLRALGTFDALVGMSALSVTLTYLMQVYTALQRKNTLGVKVHLLTGETGDAADALAGLAPQGRIESGYSQLAELGAEIASVKESHHLYPVLFFFRFREPYYSVSRFSLVALDLGSLVKSALDDDPYAWVKESAAVHQLLRGAMRLVTTLEETFLAEGAAEECAKPDPETEDRWRRRYRVALRRLQQAGIHTRKDEAAGEDDYVAMRAHWDGHIRRLAPSMAYRMEEIDIAGDEPEKALTRAPFFARAHEFA